MRKKLELLTACVTLAVATLFFSCHSAPPAPDLLGTSDPPAPRPIPTGFVYVEVDGKVLEIPRAVWEFNPAAYPPPMDPQPAAR